MAGEMRPYCRRNRMDFLVYLKVDIVLNILSLLEDPVDLICACAVSQTWRDFVIRNSLMKSLCLKKAPQLSNIVNIVEEDDDGTLVMHDRSENPLNFEVLEKDHKMYSYLLQALNVSSIGPMQCVECVIGASSTSLYPRKSIVNVLVPYDSTAWGHSFWSSEGQRDPNVPENILFKLDGGVSIVTHVEIRPFRFPSVFGLPGHTYPANSVRFKMGHPKSNADLTVTVQNLPLHQIDEDNYVWTYTSPEFPMEQAAFLQSFELPEPAFCIGGYLLIELLGRARRDLLDGRYYICLGHVGIRGHSLKPAFDIKMESSGSMLLKYRPDIVEEVLDYIAEFDDDQDENDADYDDYWWEEEDEELAEYQPMWLTQVDDLKDQLRIPQLMQIVPIVMELFMRLDDHP